MLVAVRNINCTENEVAAFCSRLANYIKREDDAFKPGLFLSALINTSSGKRFVINVQDMIPMAMLGYKNIKKITIIGDVGDGLGYKMQKGRIHVLGNVADYVGNTMTGGRIIIEGNAGDTGLCMQGGEIHVNGEIGEVDDIHMTGGRIIHKGKVITGGDE